MTGGGAPADGRPLLVRTPTHGRVIVDWPAAAPAGLLVGFHGYSENASIHAGVLRRIEARGWALASVQGLHRFYGRGDTVVASWMTREDRDQAIADNVAYVRAVVERLDGEFGRVEPLVYAGFSQGVAMAYRAAAAGARPPAGIIALAGDVPPEIKAAGTRLPPVLLGRGSGDTWYSDALMQEDVRFLTAATPRLETVVFEGGHEWAPEFVEASRKFLESLRSP